MDGLGGHYAKLNKSDRDRQILYDIAYVWNIRSTTNEWMWQKKQTHTYREQTSGYQGGKGQDRGGGEGGTNYWM